LRFGNSATLNLRVLYESQIEGCKHQDNADVHYQSFPESIPKEEQIHTNYNGYQHPNVKPDKHILCHLSLLSIPQALHQHGDDGLFTAKMQVA
jgi:hypothetical protein